MTLKEMANFVCTKVNQTGADDLTACRSFLARRQQMVWNDGLWKDSLVEYVQAVTAAAYTAASNWLPAKGVLLVPPIIERVLAVRTDQRRLNIQRPEFYYRMDYDAFAKNGSVSEFILLPPCVWEFESAQQLLLTVTLDADFPTAFTADVLDADGIGVTRTAATVSGAAGAQLATTERVDTLSKPATTGTAVLALTGGGTLVTLAATDTNAARRQRIKVLLLPNTGDTFTFRVLGKRKCPVLTADNDEPAIGGVDNCLLAFAQADMLQRERRYGQAQAVFAEGVGLLDQLKRLETVQQAHHVRLTPDAGFVSEYQFYSGVYTPLTF